MKRQLDVNSREYHNELERQAELRYNQRQRDKAEEQRLALEVMPWVSKMWVIISPVLLQHATRETQLWGSNPNPDPIRRVVVDPTEVQVSNTIQHFLKNKGIVCFLTTFD